MLTGNVTLIPHHQRSKVQNIVVHGHLFGGQLYTHPLIIPDLHPNDPNATMQKLFQLARAQDKSFINSCKHAVDVEIAHVKALKHQQLNQLLRNIPHMFKGVNIRRLKELVVPFMQSKLKQRNCFGISNLDILAMNTFPTCINL